MIALLLQHQKSVINNDSVNKLQGMVELNPGMTMKAICKDNYSKLQP